jgi:hypothetical protein
MLNDFFAFVGRLWPLVALLAAIGGAFWYFATLDSRVRVLEERVHTLAVAPTIANTVVDPKGGAPSPTATHTTEPILNPVAAACANLAEQVAKDMGNALYSSAENKREMMQSLGCLPASVRK